MSVEVSLDEQIQRLQQCVIEDTQQRANIREKIKTAIYQSLDTGLKDIYSNMREAIAKYLSGSYYQSKELRLDLIRHLYTADIASEILMVVTPLNGVTSIQNIAARLATWLELDDVFTGVRTAAELLAVCRHAGLYEMRAASEGNTKYMSIEPLGSLDKGTLEFIEKTMYPAPMITKPKDWHTNNDGGYISTRSSVLLGRQTHHDEYQALDALNIAQSIAWELDVATLQEQEMSKKPFDTPEQLTAFQRMADTSRSVCRDLYRLGNKFYLVCKYDFRGRVYTQGYHVNHQSTAYKKAVLNFAKHEVIQ